MPSSPARWASPTVIWRRPSGHWLWSPTSSFFEGLSDQINLFYGQGEPEVTQPVQEEAGGQFIGPHAPSSQFLAKRIPLVLRGCQHIAVRKDFLTTIFEDLHLFQASPRKRLKIAEILNIIEENQDVFLKLYENPKSQGGAGHYLMVVVHDWEREQELAWEFHFREGFFDLFI